MIRVVNITRRVTMPMVACLTTTMSWCEQSEVIYFAMAIMQIDRKSRGRNQDETCNDDMYDLSKHTLNFSASTNKTNISVKLFNDYGN